MSCDISIICPSMRGGGAEKISINLSSYFCELGYDVDLVIFQAVGPYLHHVHEKVNLVNINKRVIKNIWGLNLVLPLRKYFIKTKPRAVLSVLRSSNVVVGMSVAGLGIPNIVFREANTLDELMGLKLFKRISYLLRMRLSYLSAKKIIANSHDTLDDLIDNHIISSRKGIVIPNPVLPDDYSELGNIPVSEAVFLNKRYTIFLSIGRLHPQKNHSLLINSFYYLLKHRKDIRLIIIGEGPKKDSLLELINRLKLSRYVSIFGFRNNVYPYLKQSDIFVLSSNYEGFGNVLVEAMAFGKPIVCTDCHGGPKMILDNGRYGTLVQVNDVESLTAAMLKALDQKTDKSKLIARSEEFLVSKIGNQYLKQLGFY